MSFALHVYLLVVALCARPSSQCSFHDFSAELGRISATNTYDKGSFVVFCSEGGISSVHDPELIFDRFACFGTDPTWYALSCDEQVPAKAYNVSIFISLVCEVPLPTQPHCNHDVIPSSKTSTALPAHFEDSSATCFEQDKLLFYGYPITENGWNTTVALPILYLTAFCVNGLWEPVSFGFYEYPRAEHVEIRACDFANVDNRCTAAGKSNSAEPPFRELYSCSFTCPDGKKMFNAEDEVISGAVQSGFLVDLGQWLPMEVTESPFAARPILSPYLYCDFDCKCNRTVTEGETQVDKVLFKRLMLYSTILWQPTSSAECVDDWKKWKADDGYAYDNLECRTCTMPPPPNAAAVAALGVAGAAPPLAQSCSLKCPAGKSLFLWKSNGTPDKMNDIVQWTYRANDPEYPVCYYDVVERIYYYYAPDSTFYCASE